MAVFAVRRRCAPLPVGFDELPTPDVLGVGDRLEVVRVDASPVAAQVVEFKPRGDRPDMEFITDAVCVLHPVVAELAVAVSVFGPAPFPASPHRVDMNLAKESFHRRHAPIVSILGWHGGMAC